jgi:tetratricopeptide (TPR) repeat protein
MPRWLSEGISVYEERQEDPSWGQVMTPEYRSVILSGKMPPVSHLSAAFLSPSSPMALQFAYFESSLVVEFIIERHGLEALKLVLADLGAGMPIDAALAQNVAPLNRLDKEFEKFARERAEQLAPKLTWEAQGEEAEEEARERPANADAIAALLEEQPADFKLLVAWGQALQREERWQESLEPAKRLRDDFPDYVGSGNGYILSARAYRELDDPNSEVEALESWAKRASDVPDVYDRLAELAAEAKDWEAVEKNARRLLAVNPLTPAPHRWLAKAAEMLGHADDAIAAQSALLEFDTADPVDAHFRLALLLRDRGDRDAARRHVLMALEDAPRFLQAHRLLLELTGETEKDDNEAGAEADGSAEAEADGDAKADADQGSTAASPAEAR